MKNPSILRGLAHVRYHAADLEAAKRWYAELLGQAPYFARGDAYAEFRVGDFQHELGLLSSKYLGELGGGAVTTAPSGVVASWHVDDVQVTLARMLSLGATVHEAPRHFGEGFIGASVVDPFGNIVGVMQNPNYVKVLAGR